MRLIDADALKVKVTNILAKTIVYSINEGVDVLKMVDATPTIEAEPVRHGEWVGTEYDGYADGNPVYYLWQCSCCHEEYESDGMPPWYDYCPNCGVKMDGGASDENA